MKIILNLSVKHDRIEEQSGAEEFMEKKNKSLMAALAVLATFLWGSAFPSVKLGYEIFKIQGDDIGSKLLFAGIRFAAAGLMVLAVLGVQTRQRPLPKKGAFKQLLTLGILQTTIQYYFFYVGLAHTTGAKGSIINSFTAFFPVVLAPFFFKSDRLTAKKIIGCAVGLSGIILIDFINMQNPDHQDELFHVLQKHLRKDTVKCTAVDITPLHILEMTRQKVRRPVIEDIHSLSTI